MVTRMKILIIEDDLEAGYDVLVIDRMLPRRDGLSVIPLREQGVTPRR
jgi:CheY-like chemotaxis protein